jgi:hypothetical protein
VLLWERQKQLRSPMGLDSGTSPVRMVDVEFPKQDMVSKSIINSSRNKGKISWVFSNRVSSGCRFSYEEGKDFVFCTHCG